MIKKQKRHSLIGYGIALVFSLTFGIMSFGLCGDLSGISYFTRFLFMFLFGATPSVLVIIMITVSRIKGYEA